MHPSPLFSSTRSERRWTNHISNNYTKNLRVDPCVFQVPHSLRDENPQAYTPQVVGLGPFHHLRPEVQEMENLKRTIVKNFLNLPDDFQQFIEFAKAPKRLQSVNDGKNVLSIILPYYGRFLDLESKTLMWILAIDGIFLLHFLEDESGWKKHRMVADVVMLENQIPVDLLKNVREALNKSFPNVPDLILRNHFWKFCLQQSPLKLREDAEGLDDVLNRSKHLLDCLYLLIVENYKEAGQESGKEGPKPRSSLSRREVLKQAISIVSELTMGMVQDIVTAMGQAKSQGLRVPRRIDNVSKILEQLQQTTETYEKRDKDVQPQSGLANKIDVPSVSQLSQLAGIDFVCCACDGGIRNIFFDDGKNTLYLPEIRLSETSEVVLRNLIAYEAASKPLELDLGLAEVEPDLVFAEYVDLMCGIINSVNDVKLLKQSGIIRGNLLDEEIVRIFNGINKSIQIPDELSDIQRTVQQLSNWFRQKEATVRPANEIKVPSASELRRPDVKFAPADDGKRSTILFEENEESTTLYLPEIDFRDTSKCASKKLNAERVVKGALKKLNAKHADFVCAIIQNDGDVMLLKKSNIIKGDLSDEEIFRMFDGVKKSIQIPGKQSEIRRTFRELFPERANEIEVPSVFKLNEDGIQFSCTDGGSKKKILRRWWKKEKILLEKKVNTLYLQEIELGDTPENALERLGAYEAEYVDFMCSIIKDESDVKSLRESKIIKGNLPDAKIADLFNQKRRDIEWPKQLTLVQETVHKLNRKFRNSPMVKAYKFFKTFFQVFQHWVKRLFPTLVLLLLIFQSACQVRNCRSLGSGPAAASEAKMTVPRKVLGL